MPAAGQLDELARVARRGRALGVAARDRDRDDVVGVAVDEELRDPERQPLDRRGQVVAPRAASSGDPPRSDSAARRDRPQPRGLAQVERRRPATPLPRGGCAARRRGRRRAARGARRPRAPGGRRPSARSRPRARGRATRRAGRAGRCRPPRPRTSRASRRGCASRGAGTRGSRRPSRGRRGRRRAGPRAAGRSAPARSRRGSGPRPGTGPGPAGSVSSPNWSRRSP